MISRRHIRLKVMQSLYTFKSKKDQSTLNGEKDMLKHIEDISKLQIVVISFLLLLFRHAQNFFEENKIEIEKIQRYTCRCMLDNVGYRATANRAGLISFALPARLLS